ncbi:MAG: hypothetical protein IT269_04870 [Saprospiraceae bacterium]|nr:hypothetical protein [Saprospiraceae bacterium]
MHLHPNRIYHVYNRGNQRQRIFFSRANYLFFLGKIRRYWLPYCDILCYCLMPNHFHWLIKTNDLTTQIYPKFNAEKSIIRYTNFSWGTQQLLTSYTKAMQKQENFTGSLFTQNTKAKQVSGQWSWDDYTQTCFRYILNNPVKAGLVRHPGDWEFSSYRDFAGWRDGTLCNQEVAADVLAFHRTSFFELMGGEGNPDVERKIW